MLTAILYRRDPAFYGRSQKPSFVKEVADCQTERFAGRQALLNYAEEKGIPVTSTRSKPWYTSTEQSLHAGIIY